MQDERRLHPRAVVRLSGEMRETSAPEWRSVIVHDLSAGGAGVHAGWPLDIQSEVQLRFRLPGPVEEEGFDVDVLCLVVRTGPSAPPDSKKPFLAGLHFLTLQGEGFDRVRSYVWELLHPDSP